ncbi:TlpA family protein disulfide reductase [Chitinophaga pendula]|uniref:peroxiredoxin family protein n=1 Tax=Chitinophaga TaxID=79328 RepID=UPI000BB0255C|nr:MULTISPECIES: TlpA disulfide reductase family protein [Chitinophaga]ASZ12195.1 redoxin [Chitinophaga sp. MD30]UCJ04776.1 TlpA family protein disulfide reductase [Chitinophaga pendula]
MKRKYHLLIIGLLLFSSHLFAQQQITNGRWHALLHRKDGHQIPFEADIRKDHAGKIILDILNREERISTYVQRTGDSLTIRMPVFESWFKLKIVSTDSIEGVWVSHGDSNYTVLPVTIKYGSRRFPAAATASTLPITGKWRIEFTRQNQTKRPAIGAFKQRGDRLSGSVLTPSGDYRYLDGVVSGDSLLLSTFDGAHAFLLTAAIYQDRLQGTFYAGATAKETWSAVRDEQATLPRVKTTIKEGDQLLLNFHFRDIDGQPLSLQDERYKNKVIVLQLMGSWCPNCMDETAFLSKYYRQHKEQGLEIIALGYELSTDSVRSVASLQQFRKQFQVAYAMVNTGVTASDPLRTAKTFPQLSEIKVFPTTIILDRNGIVQDVSAGFWGPGAPAYHQQYISHFEETIQRLLSPR